MGKIGPNVAKAAWLMMLIMSGTCFNSWSPWWRQKEAAGEARGRAEAEPAAWVNPKERAAPSSPKETAANGLLMQSHGHACNYCLYELNGPRFDYCLKCKSEWWYKGPPGAAADKHSGDDAEQ